MHENHEVSKFPIKISLQNVHENRKMFTKKKQKLYHIIYLLYQKQTTELKYFIISRTSISANNIKNVQSN